MLQNTLTPPSALSVKLTQYSHGAGGGCKISPQVLSTILASQLPVFTDPHLLVGNQSRDAIAVYKLNNDMGIYIEKG